jgi:hypothetical protein
MKRGPLVNRNTKEFDDSDSDPVRDELNGIHSRPL